MDPRSRPWRLWRGVIALALVPLLAGLLVVLLAPSGGPLTDIGSGLVSSAVIGVIFAVVQYTIDRRNQAQDQEADLRNTLNSSRELPGIDLSGRFLAGVYLSGKVLESARLERADLTAA